MTNDVAKVMKMIDHTNLKQGLLVSDLEKLCAEAKQYGFCSVCVHPSNVAFCKKLLKDSGVLVCTVIGFPLGENTSRVKAFEASNAIALGADEIDMVISNSLVKRGEFAEITNEINEVKAACGIKTLKVIIETCLLTKEEIVEVSKAVMNSDAQFVKTSTGFRGEGATVENVALIKSVVGNKKLIKAAGGISGGADALDMIEAGANRLGTSRGALIAKDLLGENPDLNSAKGEY